MKKQFISGLFFVFILAAFFTACSNNASSAGNLDEEIEIGGEADSIMKKEVQKGALEIPVEPPVSQEIDSIAKVLSIQSPFLELGCCQEEAKRMDLCCCKAVFKEYETMLANKDPKLAEYTMQDPILGKCRNKFPDTFDAIANPKKEEEESVDDLY